MALLRFNLTKSSRGKVFFNRWPFVPINFVYNYFCLLMSTLEPTAELQQLILYFVNTWLGPRNIVQFEPPLAENEGGAADGWIRRQIEALNLAQHEALFPPQLWNVVARVGAGLGRTNNSLEGWHAVWNSHLRGTQRLSAFMRKMIQEDEMWAARMADFEAAPRDGVKGPYDGRKAKYIRQDENLHALVQDFDNRDPLIYLRACAYHLHF